ncbi:MAG TPA: cytidine deaminase [Candidatus Ornithoclostridium faecigallinarum]|nr:cytidine deaminase [Candidatus Ornithoclostridium faecigallinarum]
MSFDCEKLIDAARRAAVNAYARYSGVKIGAAAYANGKYYSGCNVENASFGLTVCAERVALFSAVADGVKSIDAIAVYSDDVEPVPCGACRQVVAEFAAKDCRIFVCKGDAVKEFSASELLPHSFTLSEDKK